MPTDTLKSTLEMQGSFLQGQNCWAVAPTVFLLQWAVRAEDFEKFLGQKSCFITRSVQFQTLLVMFNKQAQCNS